MKLYLNSKDKGGKLPFSCQEEFGLANFAAYPHGFIFNKAFNTTVVICCLSSRHIYLEVDLDHYPSYANCYEISSIPLNSLKRYTCIQLRFLIKFIFSK